MSVNSSVSSRFNLDDYKASDVDDSEPAYFGFTNSGGDWYVLKAATSGAVTTYTFHKNQTGDNDYPTSWTNRASLSYQRFDEEF